VDSYLTVDDFFFQTINPSIQPTNQPTNQPEIAQRKIPTNGTDKHKRSSYYVMLLLTPTFQISKVPKWGRAIYRPIGLDHSVDRSAIPYGSSHGWILSGNLRDVFINLAISPTIAVSISAGYRSGFPHILILSVAK